MDYNFPFILCGASFLLAMCIEAMFIPRILLISFKKRLYDLPNLRKSHTAPTSRLAGATFFPITLLCTLPAIAYLYSPISHIGYVPTYAITTPFQWAAFTCGIIVLFLLGLKDDLVGVRYSHKFLIQALAALFFVFSGHLVDNLYGLFGIHALPPAVSIPFTMLLVVYIINAINLIDGVDGLAGTLTLIACAVSGIFALAAEELIYALIAFSTCGLLVTFLYYNLFSPRKIFMGDTGSTTLGYLLALFAVHNFHETTSLPTASPAVAWSLLFIPFIDTFRVICVRIWHRRPIFSPDCNHIHHLLIRLGYKHSEISLMLGGYSLIIILSNYLLNEFIGNFTIIFSIDIILAVIIYICLAAEIKKGEEKSSPQKIRLGSYTLSPNYTPCIPYRQIVVNTLNPHSWVTAKTDAHFHRALQQSDYLIPDGTGIVLGVRLTCRQCICKTAGADLHRMFLAYLEEIEGTVFYMGCTPEVLQRIEARIHREYPHIKVNSYSPPFRSRFSDEENRRMVDAANCCSPDVLFVGMTAPKQEKWIYDHRHELNAHVISGIGAVFGFYAGTSPRPPHWMICLGLEWLGRLVQNPRRMWRRNFISSPIFLKDMFMLMMQPKKDKETILYQ